MILKFCAQSFLGRVLVAFLGISLSLPLTGCSNLVSLRRVNIIVSVPNSFSQVYAGSASVTLTATLQNDPTTDGVIWGLTVANGNCSPACGTLTKSSSDPRLSVIYTPPASAPANSSATITASSAANSAAVFVFNFTINPAISVSIPNAFTSQKSGDPSVVVNATVTNDLANTGVTWSLTNNGQSCPAAVCGTLTSPPSPTLTATYTPPATIAPGASPTPTITATSVTDPTKSASFTFTIVPGIVVTITNKFTKQIIGSAAVTVNVTVSNDSSNAGVAWSLVNANGQACSNCGTLVPNPAPSFAATYTPPTTQPVGPDATPTITAVSVANATKSDSFSFTITIGTASFAGSYAFSLRGYDLNDSPLALAGSVTFDALGDVTNGDLDINNGGGLTSISGLTGTFSPDSSFNGITRITVNLQNGILSGSNTSAPLPTPISFKSVISTDRTHGRILELDGFGFVNVGSIQLQDSTALTSANPAGTYAFGVDSDSPLGGRTVEAGQLVLTSTGVSGGLVDESKAGDPTPRYSAVPLAGSSLTAPDANGRGTLTLSVNVAGVTASSDHYAYYIVNSGQLLLLQMDSAPTFGTVFSGTALAQQSLTSTSVISTSVLQLTGMDTVPGTTSQVGPDVIIGVMSISAVPGQTADAFQLTFDENDLGKTFAEKKTAGSIIFDPTSGRGTISDTGGFGISFMDSAVFYISSTGAGFIIDADPSTCVPGGVCPPPNNYPITNNAFSGTLIPQTGAGSFGPSSFSGNVIFASGGTAVFNIPSVVAGLNLNSATGAYSAAGDLTSQNFEAGNLPNVTFNGSFSIEDSLGHTIISMPPQIFGEFTGIQPNQLFPAFGYLVGTNQMVAIGFGNGVTPSDSSILFFDPQ